MTRSPIPRVLSTFRSYEVQALLMGGQACILYGAAEFSRDIDFAILLSAANLERLGAALQELRADVIAVPPFKRRHLERGHAIHFRAQHPEAKGFRIDVMSKLRRVDPFSQLWERRTTFELTGVGALDVLSLADLVASKKTQRDKDWSMIRRLVEANYAQAEQAAQAEHAPKAPTLEQILFWLQELRTPEILVTCAKAFPEQARRVARKRPAAGEAITGDLPAIEAALSSEEARERALDREYWAPLRAELEELRRQRG